MVEKVHIRKGLGRGQKMKSEKEFLNLVFHNLEDKDPGIKIQPEAFVLSSGSSAYIVDFLIPGEEGQPSYAFEFKGQNITNENVYSVLGKAASMKDELTLVLPEEADLKSPMINMLRDNEVNVIKGSPETVASKIIEMIKEKNE